MLKVIYIFGHVFIVNSRCYGRCYVKKRMPLCTFLKFHTHLEGRKFGKIVSKCFGKSSRVLSLVFPRNWIFHEHRHILGYHTPLTPFRGLVRLLIRHEGHRPKTLTERTGVKKETVALYFPNTIPNELG